MSSSQGYYYYPSSPVPISQPSKQQQGYYYPHGYPTQQNVTESRMSVSPPEGLYSGTTSGVASYDPSAASTTGSYAGSASASDYDSSNSTASVDLLDYMSDRLNGAFDPIPLDRSLAQQAQTSGQLNAKTQQLLELQKLAQSRFAAAQASFADGMKSAKEVQRDLEWTQKRVSAINQRAAKKYPEQYCAASQKYPAPVDY